MLTVFPKEIGSILSPVIYIINPAVTTTMKPVSENVISSYKNNATRYPIKIGIVVDDERRKDFYITNYIILGLIWGKIIFYQS